MYIITISRQTASRGNEIGKKLANKLGYRLISRDYVVNNWLKEVASEHELNMLKESSKFYQKKCDQGITFADFIEKRLINLAGKEPLVVMGLGSQVIFRNVATAIHIRIVASEKNRLEKISHDFGLNKKQAARTIELSDRKHRRYVWKIYKEDWADPTLYHICLNTDGITIEDTVDLLIQLIDMKKSYPEPLGESQPLEHKDKKPEFVHQSEEKFADILDMHNIKWEYEPTEFPLEWDLEGNIKKGFRPDFYLPEFDTYIELTTMKREYVTEKNKKVRLLRKLYPDVNINIVYKKDFHAITERFGFRKG